MWKFVEMYVWSNNSMVCVWSCCPNVSVTQSHNMSTADMNCLVKQTFAYTENVLYSQTEHWTAAHHLLHRNGAAISSDSLAIKILPRRINCNSPVMAYHLLTCLSHHQLETSLPGALKPLQWHWLSSQKATNCSPLNTDTLLVLTIRAATDWGGNKAVP
jgi:hypothetical protein